VGVDLQDHPLVTTVLHSGRRQSTVEHDKRRGCTRLPAPAPWTARLFHTGNRETPSREDLPAPDIQLTLALTALDSHRQVYPKPAVTCSVSLLTPTSRGEVRLASADPLGPNGHRRHSRAALHQTHRRPSTPQPLSNRRSTDQWHRAHRPRRGPRAPPLVSCTPVRPTRLRAGPTTATSGAFPVAGTDIRNGGRPNLDGA
jgi:hypothetical protein